MTKRLLSKVGETETWMHDADKGFIIEKRQEVDAILDANKAQAAEYRKGSMIGNTQRHWQHVAEIPATVFLELRAKLGEPKDNPTEWKRWLNDYDNRFFRTGGGNI